MGNGPNAYKFLVRCDISSTFWDPACIDFDNLLLRWFNLNLSFGVGKEKKKNRNKLDCLTCRNYALIYIHTCTYTYVRI